jgi:tetratricopeptide (TPR) repeat protein
MIVSAWPEDNKSRYYLAVAYERKGHLKEAIDNFSLIKKGSRYYINAQIHLGYIFESQKKYDKAITVIKKAVDLEKKNTELYLVLASFYEGKGELEKAVETVKLGIEQDGKNKGLIFRLGVLFDKMGNKTACIEQMRRILALDPNHAAALNYIGYTYADQGINLDEAMELIEKALRLKPDSGYIIDSLGWVYFKKGSYSKALYYLEKAVALTPDDPTINEHIGDVYFQTRDFKKALKMYNKALLLGHPEEEKLKKKISKTKERI